MTNAQLTSTCKILLHPTACTRAVVNAFQHRTGMLIVINTRGYAHAVPATKGAA